MYAFEGRTISSLFPSISIAVRAWKVQMLAVFKFSFLAPKPLVRVLATKSTNEGISRLAVYTGTSLTELAPTNGTQAVTYDVRKIEAPRSRSRAHVQTITTDTKNTHYMNYGHVIRNTTIAENIIRL